MYLIYLIHFLKIPKVLTDEIIASLYNLSSSLHNEKSWIFRKCSKKKKEAEAR